MVKIIDLDNIGVNEATDRDVLDNFTGEIFSNFNCVKVGKITKFDATKKTCEVQIMIRRDYGTSIQSWPLLIDCPVFTLNGGGAVVQMPIAAGDTCLVLFNDANIDNWFAAGVESDPMTLRKHDLSDGIALVGIESLASNLPAYAVDRARINYSGAEIGIKNTGKVYIKNASTNLLTAMLSLITVLEAFAVDPASHIANAATIAALEVVKSTLSELMDSGS